MPDEINRAAFNAEFKLADVAGKTRKAVPARRQLESKIGGTIGRALMLVIERKTDCVTAEIEAIAVQVDDGFSRQRFETFGLEVLRRRFARHAAAQRKRQGEQAGVKFKESRSHFLLPRG